MAGSRRHIVRWVMANPRPLTFGCVLWAASIACAQVNQPVDPQWSDARHRQFDFWIGGWDVLLRIRQPDGGWSEDVLATAQIYRVLGGKAILELWDQDEPDAARGIRGFSLRYVDGENGAADTWRLWLNWPGANRSTLGSLRGRFRHGRGEFFNRFPGPGVEGRITRYTFSDIGPDRLRWDDAYSEDGGATWRGQWIMEWTRRTELPSWPGLGEAAHGYRGGGRCTLAPFRVFERMVGTWVGTVEVDGEEGPARLQAWPILGGCAVMSFFEYHLGGELRREFALSSFNTQAQLLEDARLDDRPGTGLRQYFGRERDGELVLQSRQGELDPMRTRWSFPSPQECRMVVEALAGEGSEVVRTVELQRVLSAGEQR